MERTSSRRVVLAAREATEKRGMRMGRPEFPMVEQTQIVRTITPTKVVYIPLLPQILTATGSLSQGFLRAPHGANVFRQPQQLSEKQPNVNSSIPSILLQICRMYVDVSSRELSRVTQERSRSHTSGVFFRQKPDLQALRDLMVF